MKSIAILVALLALTGCATQSVSPQVVYRDKEVKVPVRETCKVAIPAEPKWETEVVNPDADWLELTKAIVIELEQRRDYQQRVIAASKKCE